MLSTRFPILLLLFVLPLGVSSSLQAQSRYQSRYLKSVDDARSKAMYGTIVPIGLGIGTAALVENATIEKMASFMVVYGLVMGPSFGNLYAKDYVRGMLGAAARIGGGYLLLDATRELAGDDVADGLGWDDKSVGLNDTRVLVGGGIILASAIYNIVSARASVNEYNENIGYEVQVAPSYQGGQMVPMISANIRF